MRWVAAGHEIESEIAHSIDLRSVLMSWVTAGHEIENEAGLPSLPSSFRSRDPQWPSSLRMTPGQCCAQSRFRFCDQTCPPSRIFLRMVHSAQ